jgi:hypothetical protein
MPGKEKAPFLRLFSDMRFLEDMFRQNNGQQNDKECLGLRAA